MRKIFGIIILMCMLLLCSCGHEHMWEEATCTSPKTCIECNEVEGEALGHTWNDATCSTPKTCSQCNETEGETLEHTWVDATCVEPKTCTVCNKKSGSALDHDYGEWQVKKEATVLESGEKIHYCSNCNNVQNWIYDLSSYIKNNQFIFTPEEFRKLYFDNFVELNFKGFGGAQVKTNDGQVMVAIMDSGYNNVGNIGFVVDGSLFTMATSSTDRNFDGLVMILASKSDDFVVNAILSFIQSCDPSIKEYGARSVAIDMISNKTSVNNGIEYRFSESGYYYSITAIPVS